MKTLKVGTKSETLGASIENIKENSWQNDGSHNMEVKLKVENGRFEISESCG